MRPPGLPGGNPLSRQATLVGGLVLGHARGLLLETLLLLGDAAVGLLAQRFAPVGRVTARIVCRRYRTRQQYGRRCLRWRPSQTVRLRPIRQSQLAGEGRRVSREGVEAARRQLSAEQRTFSATRAALVKLGQPMIEGGNATQHVCDPGRGARVDFPKLLRQRIPLVGQGGEIDEPLSPVLLRFHFAGFVLKTRQQCSQPTGDEFGRFDCRPCFIGVGTLDRIEKRLPCCFGMLGEVFRNVHFGDRSKGLRVL
jgi:hypothetical protein